VSMSHWHPHPNNNVFKCIKGFHMNRFLISALTVAMSLAVIGTTQAGGSGSHGGHSGSHGRVSHGNRGYHNHYGKDYRWSHRYWDRSYGCYLYYEPGCSYCYRYCAPENCYYPVYTAPVPQVSVNVANSASVVNGSTGVGSVAGPVGQGLPGPGEINPSPGSRR
jgi:hypothetical protein